MHILYTYKKYENAHGYHKIDEEEFCEAFDEKTNQLQAGAYTTFRTYKGSNVFQLSLHLERLAKTLRIAIININVFLQDIRNSLKSLYLKDASRNYRIRVIIPFSSNYEKLYIMQGELAEPSMDQYNQGVKVLTTFFERNEPERKLTGFIAETSDIRKLVRNDVAEILLVNNEGNITEGLSSNAFFVKKQSVITSEKDILAGITRKIVLVTCEELKIPVWYRALMTDEIASCDEAFITSTSRAVLPVTKIDTTQIGSGLPGEITRALIGAFTNKIEEGLEDIYSS